MGSRNTVRIDDLIKDGRFFLSEEVWEEVKTKDENAKAWGEPRVAKVVVRTDASVARAVQAILDPFELMVKNMKGRNRADLFRQSGGPNTRGFGFNGRGKRRVREQTEDSGRLRSARDWL